jgi:ABC-type long-subunit fatty acid transport system fused permease/ATPase subunit
VDEYMDNNVSNRYIVSIFRAEGTNSIFLQNFSTYREVHAASQRVHSDIFNAMKP